MRMEIRPYKEEDAQRIFELFNETTLSANWEDFSEEQKEVALFKDAEYVDETMKNSLSLVLEDEGEIRGFICVTEDGYVRFFYVDKRYLGKGYGRALGEAMLKKAKEAGLKKIWGIASKYASDRKLYEKMGCVNKGMDSFELFGVKFEGYRMEKEI